MPRSRIITESDATQPTYGASRVYLVVRTDYEALPSEDYAPAFEQYAYALRLVCRMAAAAPAPLMAMRRLNVAATQSAPAGPSATSAPKPSQPSGRRA